MSLTSSVSLISLTKQITVAPSQTLSTSTVLIVKTELSGAGGSPQFLLNWAPRTTEDCKAAAGCEAAVGCEAAAGCKAALGCEPAVGCEAVAGLAEARRPSFVNLAC